jgi:hypothetical protein
MNQCAELIFGTAGTLERITLNKPPIPISIRWDGGSKQNIFKAVLND